MPSYKSVVLADDPLAYWTLGPTPMNYRYFTYPTPGNPTTQANFELLFTNGATSPECGLVTLAGSGLWTAGPIAYNESNTTTGQFQTAKPSFLPADQYALEVTGTFTAPVDGSYGFMVRGDDGHDCWINGTRVSGTYGPMGVQNSNDPNVVPSDTGYITLTGGQRYTFQSRMQEGGGGDAMILLWKPPGFTTFRVIPYTVLGGPTDQTARTLKHQIGYEPTNNPTASALDFAAGALVYDADQGVQSSGGGSFTSPHEAALARTSYSMEGWVKPRAANGGYDFLWSKGTGALPGRNPSVYLNPSNCIHFTQETSTPANGQCYTNGGPPLAAGVWTHVVTVCTGTKLLVYLNGVLTESVDSTNTKYVIAGYTSDQNWPAGAVLSTNTQPFYIGNKYTTQTLGVVDEVAYYDYALSAAQVAAHYNQGAFPPFTGAVNVAALAPAGLTRGIATAIPSADKPLTYPTKQISGHVYNTGSDTPQPVEGATVLLVRQSDGITVAQQLSGPGGVYLFVRDGEDFNTYFVAAFSIAGGTTQVHGTSNRGLVAT